jgi:predicted transcriptional regulator of viral defense system
MLSKNIEKLQELGKKPYFTTADVAQKFGLLPASARVFCSRYAQNGLLIRLKNNFYTTAGQWGNLTRNDMFKIANIMQVPSYVSLMSALAYYEVTTQVQGNYQESICLKRSVSYNIRDAVFNYYKFQRKYYCGFIKSNGIFIATKEKAFLDTVYLYSFGKYKFDYHALDLKKLDRKKLNDLLKIYPVRIKETVSKLCRI